MRKVVSVRLNKPISKSMDLIAMNSKVSKAGILKDAIFFVACYPSEPISKFDADYNNVIFTIKMNDEVLHLVNGLTKAMMLNRSQLVRYAFSVYSNVYSRYPNRLLFECVKDIIGMTMKKNNTLYNIKKGDKQ